MAVDLGKVFGDAFRYSFSLNRILPFFLINIFFLAILIFFADSVMNILPQVIIQASTNKSVSSLNSFGTILSFASIFIFLAIIFALVKLFFQGVITDNARIFWQQKKDVPISKSYVVGKKKYFNIVIAIILVIIVISLVGLVPLIGWIGTIIFSWFFLLIIQIIVVGNKGAVDSLKEGYNIFMKNKFDVFLFWLLLIILGGIIFIIAITPLGIVILPIIFSAIGIGSGQGTAAAIASIKGSYISIIIGGLISSFILGYLNVFQEASRTFFFLDVSKNKK